MLTFYFKALCSAAVKIWLIIKDKVPNMLTHVADKNIDSSVGQEHLVG